MRGDGNVSSFNFYQEVLGAKELMKTNKEQIKVIHTVPIMTDMERDATKKRIGSDLYEIFLRIQAELNFEMTMNQAA